MQQETQNIEAADPNDGRLLESSFPHEIPSHRRDIRDAVRDANLDPFDVSEDPDGPAWSKFEAIASFGPRDHNEDQSVPEEETQKEASSLQQSEWTTTLPWADAICEAISSLSIEKRPLPAGVRRPKRYDADPFAIYAEWGLSPQGFSLMHDLIDVRTALINGHRAAYEAVVRRMSSSIAKDASLIEKCRQRQKKASATVLLLSKGMDVLGQLQSSLPSPPMSSA